MANAHILKKHLKTGYTVIPTAIFKGEDGEGNKKERLSLKGLGLLCFMLSLPDEWDFSVTGLSKLLPDGKDGIQTAVKEIEKHGYLRRRQNFVKGKFGGYIWDVSDTPEYKPTLTEKPLTEKPLTEKPLTEKPLTEKPLTEKPLTEKPLTEKPLTEKPLTEKPLTEKPLTEKPPQESTKEESTKEESTKEESASRPVEKEKLDFTADCALGRKAIEFNGLPMGPKPLDGMCGRFGETSRVRCLHPNGSCPYKLNSRK